MIPNQWYPILESKSVRGKPIAIKRFGKPLVLWRESNKKLVCMVDRCPHRGAALSSGRVLKDTIECPYHGFQYGREGKCSLIPCQPKTKAVPPTMHVKTFMVQEAYGLIWMWWGEPEKVLPELPWFEELPKTLHLSSADSFEVPLNYVRLVESNFDVHHFPIVHRSLIFGLVGSVLDPYEVKVEGNLIRTWGKLRRDRDSAKDSSEWGDFPFKLNMRFPNLTCIQLLPQVHFITAATPIDENHSWVFIRYYQNYIRDPFLGYLLAWVLLRFEVNLVQMQQDIPILKSLHPQKPELEAFNLVSADRAIAHYYQLRDKFLKENHHE